MTRLRTLALLVAGACLFAAGGYGAALTMAPTVDVDGPAAPTAPVTSPVELRALSSQVIVRGDVGFADPVELDLVVASDVPVVTRTPVTAGATLDAGDVVAEVAGRPVFALPGRLPPYRDLVPGDLGPDVLQLEQALAAIGLDPGDVDESFTSYTSAAVRDLYERHDYEPPTLADLGVSQELEAPVIGGGPGEPDPDPGPDPADVAVLPRSEVAFVPSMPRRVDRMPMRVGGLLGERPIVLSGSELLVSVDLSAADAEVLEAGMPVKVDLPGGRPVRARLGRVLRTANGGRTWVRLPDLGPSRQRQVRAANVKVTVPLQSSEGKVLVVPLAALTTDASGTAHVEKVAGDGQISVVDVEVGLTADGYVEVRPIGDTDLAEGDQVVVGS